MATQKITEKALVTEEKDDIAILITQTENVDGVEKPALRRMKPKDLSGVILEDTTAHLFKLKVVDGHLCLSIKN